MSALGRGIVPIILQAVLIGNRCIQRFIDVKIIEAHDVQIDIRIPGSVWCIHAIKYVDAATFAKRVVRYRVFTLIFRQRSFLGKEPKRFRTNLDVPESQLATEAAIAFQRAIVEINSNFKPH
jgi:hypothetical protein